MGGGTTISLAYATLAIGMATWQCIGFVDDAYTAALGRAVSAISKIDDLRQEDVDSIRKTDR